MQYAHPCYCSPKNTSGCCIMSNRIHAAEVCDARDDASSTAAGHIKKASQKWNASIFLKRNRKSIKPVNDLLHSAVHLILLLCGEIR